VVDAVLGLEPPYRETMLLRWFEELPPRTIAERTRVPVATVHSRLQRGAALLRARLDRRYGSRHAWAGVCAALPAPLSLPLVGVTLMNVKAVAAGAVLVVGAAVWWASGTAADPGPVAKVATSAAVPTAASPVPSEPVGARVAATPDAPTGEPAGAATPMRRVTGRVLDVDGRAVRDLHLQFGDVRATSGDDGVFQVAIAAGQSGIVRSEDPRWCTVLHGVVTADSAVEGLLVVGPALDLGGTVRASDGRPIADALMRVLWPGDLRARVAAIADASAEEAHSARSDGGAKFRLATATVRGAELLVSADGYVTLRRPLPERSTTDLELVLERPVAKVGSIQGLVVDAHGVPVPGARVGLGGIVQRADDRGAFLIDDDGMGATLAAVATGHRRGVLARAEAGFPPFVTLTLGGTPLAIRGRVVDASGNGVAGAKVWCLDPTSFCESREPLVTEGLSAGMTTLMELRERFERGELKDPQAVFRSTATCGWPWVATGADGTFVLSGLDARAYSLRAMDDETLTTVEGGAVAAGSQGVQLVLPTTQRFERLTGTVVSRTGQPVAGVRLAVQTDTQTLRGNTMHAQAVARTTSDAEGRFVLPKVPHRGVYLRLDGDGILPLEYGRGQAGGLVELVGLGGDTRLTVSVRLHVQIELLDAAAADCIRVLDADAKPVALTVFQGRGRSDTDRLELTGGRSAAFVVPEGATTLVLEKNGSEVRREILSLLPGTLNTLRL
jgi:protocatechuate 3,4-dioxygenase beta subunit